MPCSTIRVSDTRPRRTSRILRAALAPVSSVEPLERRWLLSTITWMNRGQASDRFTEVFGASANLARGVIDAAIDQWERVITDFNYSDGSNTYELLVAMSATTNGFGGVGGSTATIPPAGGKPSEGTLVLYRGSDTSGDGLGDGDGWYLDSTPNDSTEFMNGTLHNAFAANAAAGSPAFSESDMLTVALHEIGHTLGIDSNATMNALATDTGINDPQGGSANLWAFDGPSVKHLFTAFDSNLGDQNGTQHSARASADINFAGENWRGVIDLMNPTYANSQRKIVNNVIAWAIHDAWDYDIALPENFGTMYSILNSATGQLTIRGAGHATSDDLINIAVIGNAMIVSVDIGQDVPGTGPLPGPGNLDPFHSTYNVADITSILIQAGDGNDTIVINTLPAGIGMTIEGGDGNDTAILGNGDLDTNLSAAITFNGGAGTDTLLLDDTTDGAGSDTYTFGAVTLTKPAGDTISWSAIEAVTLDASPNADLITVNATLPGVALTLNARGGNDNISIQGTDITSPATITTGSGSDVVNINSDDTGIGLAFFPGTESVIALNIGVGGRLALAQAPVANSRVLITQSLAIDNGGVLDLTNGSMILNYAGASPYTTARNLIASGRNGGTWTGSGITSFAAFLANPANTTLGLLEATEYWSIYGNGALFAGQAIDATSLLVKYTYYGDADFSGQVDFDDYVRTDAGFNGGGTRWFAGDFDLSGEVDFDDYVLIDLGFNTQGSPL